MAIRPFKFENDQSVADDIRSKYGFDGDLLGIYCDADGAVVHKWHHYIPLYDRYFSRFRGRPIRFLEIGVAGGGSLRMWRRYLGAEARLFGIDIDPGCAALNGEAGQVRIGSQDCPEFLREVVAEMGGVDVVLDDGSHVMDHIRSSLMALFPLLPDGGLYVIEDLHTAYWPGYGGGREVPGNFFNDIRRMVDDMHHWYHDGAANYPALAGRVTGLHVHDSFVVLEKGPEHRPVHSRVGRLS